jgi:hypothetical protein
MRGAHNLWYVYARPAKREPVLAALQKQLESEQLSDRYDFESVLDECGFRYLEKLANPSVPGPLWKVRFD